MHGHHRRFKPVMMFPFHCRFMSQTGGVVMPTTAVRDIPTALVMDMIDDATNSGYKP
jgi:hypothetical protein